jgi:IS605 OrfB family transposase
MFDMLLVVQVKLLPTPEQASALSATLRTCNDAANLVAKRAWDLQVFNRIELQRAVYAEVKALGLSAQPTIHVIRKVSDAYRTFLGQVREGIRDALTRPVQFRRDAAQSYDDRCLSWQLEARTISIWTVSGRVKDVAFTGHPDHLGLLAAHRKGESDLSFRDGKWYLIATCDLPAMQLKADPTGWLGVDLGIANIATTSDGSFYAGKKLNRYRERQRRLRKKLQSKGTRSAKRLLVLRNRKEQRTVAQVNHRIANRIVIEAERTGRGIALEDLTGIRERVRLRKPQRVTLHTWAFAELGAFIAYKAERSGVPVLFVDPRYTSQSCADCGHTARNNRIDQSRFVCRSCGVVAHADWNAARNIANRGAACWAAVNQPNVGAPALPQRSLNPPSKQAEEPQVLTSLILHF